MKSKKLVIRGVALGALLTTLILACGSSDESGFGDGTGNGDGDSGKGGSFDPTGTNPLGEGGTTKACTNLCLQQKACAGGATTSLSGTVFDPAGKVPLYNVIVYVPNAPVAPIVNGATCDRCGSVSGDPLVSAITDTSGHFELKNVPVGSNIPLVIQVGKWRRQLVIPSVAECVDTPLAAVDTRLPKNHTEGDIPLIALTTGGADALECFLRKVGLEDGEFSTGTGAGRVHFYSGSGISGNSPTTKFDNAHGGQSFSGAQAMWSSVDNLKKYDMVLLSCEGTTHPETKPQAALDALVDYANTGGRVFASHWHRYWFNPREDDNGKVTGTTKFADLGNWEDGNIASTIQATVNVSFAKGKAMQDWLGNVNALSGGKLPISGAKKNLISVNSANAQDWITYPSPQAVQYMSFNVPQGVADDQKCGRVVYSDLHVSSGVGDDPGPAWPGGCTNPDLSPQEKALEFMLFDLSSCIQNDNAPPTAPPVIN